MPNLFLDVSFIHENSDWQRNTGNDHDEDSDKEPEPPVKVIDKTPARNTKRNAGDEAPASKAAPISDRGSRRGGPTGNEGGS